MQELHFSTIDLRNKLSKGRVNNNCPIIAQVTERNNMTTAAQVRVEFYPPHDLAGEKSGDSYKEMNLHIKSAYYETQQEWNLPTLDNNILAPQIWCLTRDKLRQSCHWEKIRPKRCSLPCQTWATMKLMSVKVTWMSQHKPSRHIINRQGQCRIT